jgi:hypothetical protein
MERTSCEKKLSLVETYMLHPVLKSMSKYAMYALVYEVVSSGMMAGAYILDASDIFSKDFFL